MYQKRTIRRLSLSIAITGVALFASYQQLWAIQGQQLPQVVGIVNHESRAYLPQGVLPQIVQVTPDNGALFCAGELQTGILCCEYELDNGSSCFDCDFGDGSHTNESGYEPACYHVVIED